MRGWRDQAGKALVMVGTTASGAARDRRVQFSFVVLPVVIILLVGALFGGGGRRLPVGVVVDSRGPLTARLVEQIKTAPALQFRSYVHVDHLRRDLRRGRIVAGAVIPASFDASLLAGGDGQVTVVAQADRPEALTARLAIVEVAGVVGTEVTAARLSPPPFAAALARAQAVTDAAEAAARRLIRRRPVSPFSYTSPSNLVLFVFIISLAASSATVAVRQLGVTRRILASPTPPAVIVLGGALSAWALALGQAVFLLAVGRVLFSVHWGNPLALALLVLLLTLTAAASGMLLGTVARTPEQAIAIAVPLGIGLGMLGGCMWPLDAVGPTMRAAGHLIPQGWAMDGFVRLVYGRRSVGGIAGPLAVLFGYAVALLGLATWRTRKAVVSA